jgi:hypothetical protein
LFKNKSHNNSGGLATYRENLSSLSVGEAVDNNVHKPRKPRCHWPAEWCPKIDQSELMTYLIVSKNHTQRFPAGH